MGYNAGQRSAPRGVNDPLDVGPKRGGAGMPLYPALGRDGVSEPLHGDQPLGGVADQRREMAAVDQLPVAAELIGRQPVEDDGRERAANIVETDGGDERFQSLRQIGAHPEQL